MITPRALHTATLLEDGTVLIAGGIANIPRDAIDSSEIFDPVHGIFLPSGKMTTARQQAVATRLSDGRVLVASGFHRGEDPLMLGPILEGGYAGYYPLDTAEIYDPKSKTFSSIGPTRFAHLIHSATLLDDGRVLLIDDDSAKLFDPKNGTFTPAGKPVARRYQHAAMKQRDGRVLIACDGVNEEDRKSAEIYDPKSDRFTRTGDMLKLVSSCHTALLSNGTVLVTGTSRDTEEAEIYDPQTGTFSTAGKLIFRLADPVPSRLNDGRVLVTGTAFPLYPSRKDGLTSQLYDPSSDTFKLIGAIPPDRSEYTSTSLITGSVLIAGGEATYPPIYPDASLLYCP
jgi:large repetitive protein